MGMFSNYYEGSPNAQPKAAPFLGMDGECSFKIIGVTDGVSKSGNQQLVLTLSITDQAGTDGGMKDYFPSQKNMAWKINALLMAIGRQDLNSPKGFNISELAGCKGKAILETDEYMGVKRSKISKYLKGDAQAVRPVVDAIPEDDMDDIPF